jgi:hypothetical protein
VNSGVPNPNTKDLGIRKTPQQLFGSCQAIVGYFKSFGFNINGYNFSMIAFFDFSTDLRLDFVSAPSKFFFTIVGLSHCHGFDLFSMIAFSF